MALLAASLLSACRSTEPPEVAPPDVSLPDAFAASVSSGAVSDAPWWEEFGDAELAAVVEEALENNRDLAAASARVEQAAALARIAGADRLPTLDAGLDWQRRQQVFVGFPFGGASIFDSYQGLFRASWEADLWGRIAAGVSAAEADLVATAADREAARQSIAAQTARALLSLREAREQLAISRESVTSFERTLAMVDDRYSLGRESVVQVLLSRSDLEAARALLVQREEEEARATRRLEVLLGRYPAGALEGSATLPVLPPPPPPGLPVELLGRRPDLVASGARVAAAAARVDEAEAARWPTLTLTASGGRTSDELGDLLDGDFTIWTLAGGLTAPLFQGGRIRAGIDLADARAREAAEQWAGSLLIALAEVETALAIEQQLASQAQHLASSAAEARQARDESAERYAAGRSDFLTVLAAQRRTLEAEARLLSHRRRYLEARVDLYLALGGGFPPENPDVEDAGESDSPEEDG
jgi:NodT family efflux transporter outer membrane factor (OMF) lipoprotein